MEEINSDAVCTYVFTGEINEIKLEEIVGFLNYAIGMKKRIFFSTEGGSTDIAEVLIDIINQDAENIELVAFNTIASCGMDIFYKTNCKKYVKDGCYGLYHLSSYNMDMSERGFPTHKDTKWVYNHSRKFSNVNTDRMCYKLQLTKSETAKIKRGEDVLFSTERLRDFIDKFQEQ
jgi:hypothetical protein